jgi:trimeric autotransporter adhesin
MKKAGTILISIVCLFTLLAQDKLYLHKTDKSVLELLVSAIDSITFGSNQTNLNFYKTDKTISTFAVSAIDSITFGAVADTIIINYSGTSATITNPLVNSGITTTSSGGDVVVNASLDNDNVVYVLTGTTTDGSFKVYNTNRFNLVLKGVSITNSDGPAINIQSSKKISVTLADGTTNSLTDGTTYATSTEDQKAAFFSEGQLVFAGSGALNVKSLSKHGICSDGYIQIISGNITVTGASKDGVHSKDYFRMSGGSLNVTSKSDGIECEAGHVVITGGTITTVTTAADTKGIAADSTLTVSDGTLNLTVSGNQAKGLKSKQDMILNGGNITINTSGGVILAALGLGYDPSYCTAIKSNTNLTIAGATITIVSTGSAGKGVSADGNLTMSSGTVNVTTSGAGATFTNSLGVVDSYASSCFEADGNINIQGGSLTAICSGAGSKGISADGNLSIGDATHTPIVNVTNTGTKFLVSGTANYANADYSEPKAIKSDGILTIANGTFTLSASQQGANVIDSDSILNITGGTIGITLAGNQSKGIKATRVMNLNGGVITIGATGGVVLELTAASKYDPSYCTAIKGSSDINIGGSNITITSSGAAGKGISSDTNINMTSGTVNVTCSGTGTTYVNSSGVTDSYNSSCFTADINLNVIGGTLNCTNSGLGGKTMSADGAITIGDATNSPIITLTTTGARFLVSGTDYCHPKTMLATGAITINNGTSVITSTDDGIHSGTSITINGGNHTIKALSSIQGIGEGVEAPIITFNGGLTNIDASNDGINATYGTVSGGTESNDGSYLYVKGGIVIVSGSDAVDSNGNIQVTGGTIIVNGPSSGVEEGFDFNGTFNINGGLVMSAGSNSNMSKAMSTTSTQPGMFIKSNALIASTSILHIENASGTDIITFKPKNGGYYFHASTSTMTKGAAYKIYTGGTYTGGSYVGGTSGYGLYTGGTYSTTGASLKSTTTLSSSSTVNTISF